MPKRVTIARLQAEYGRYYRRIDSSQKLHTFTVVNKDFAEPYVQVRADGYHWIATERGRECLHRVTTRMDTLLYWIISDVTCNLATKYELEHRVAGPDCRRAWFAKQIELMTTVKPRWGELLREKLDAILADYPYEDDEVVEGTVVTPVRGLVKIR